MNGPRTTKEALIAEMLGDLDRLLARAEALPVAIREAEERTTGMIAGLNEAGDRFRMRHHVQRGGAHRSGRLRTAQGG